MPDSIRQSLQYEITNDSLFGEHYLNFMPEKFVIEILSPLGEERLGWSTVATEPFPLASLSGEVLSRFIMAMIPQPSCSPDSASSYLFFCSPGKKRDLKWKGFDCATAAQKSLTRVFDSIPVGRVPESLPAVETSLAQRVESQDIYFEKL